MNNRDKPLARTDSANGLFTAFLVIFALLMLLFGNNVATRNLQIFGAKASETLNGIGMAVLIAAITQYYTDFRVRGRFYNDISDHIVANESIRDSGIVKFFEDSRDCSPKSRVRIARQIDLGVTYSDRFLKENHEVLVENKDRVSVRLFMCDGDDENCVDIISKNIGITAEEVGMEFSKINRLVESLKERGVKIEVFKQKSIPHYSFYIFDSSEYFVTLSTFASRRAEVPLIQAASGSPLAELVSRDCAHILAAMRDGVS